MPVFQVNPFAVLVSGWKAGMGCAGPYPELQEGFTDTEVLKEDVGQQDPTLCVY